MPTAPLRPCAAGNLCRDRALVAKGYCPTCEKAREQDRGKVETWRKVKGKRGGMVDMYTTTRWRRLRALVLREANHLCQCKECRSCKKCGKQSGSMALTCETCGALLLPKPATVADHRQAHRGRPELMWDRDNLEAMSAECHSAKTAGEVMHGR